jgi:N6-adenosine-specific RNA methylase IME4
MANDLTISKNNLPSKPEGLHKFILVGKEVLKAHKAKIRAIERINESYTVKRVTLKDAQDIADALLEAEKKFGEILARIPKQPEPSTNGRLGGSKPILPSGITHKESHKAQVIAKHPKVIKQVKVKARQEKRIATSEEVYKEIKKEEHKENIQEQIKIIESRKDESKNRKYDVIVVDPPWPYQKRLEDVSHKGKIPYPSMTIDEIMEYKDKIPANENCILWLWTTNAFMHEAFHVLERWGFQPKTIVTWVKNKIGSGDWLRGKTEHCILAVKGHPIVTIARQRLSVIFLRPNLWSSRTMLYSLLR